MKNIANVGLAALVMASGMVAGPNEITLTGATRAKVYANCTALNRDYPHGVGLRSAKDRAVGRTRPVTTFTRNDAVYRINKSRDADHDGIACEKR